MISATYPPRAARALARLKGAGNDIEIFVEDTANPNVWLYYIRQHLPTGKSLKSVNVLGSKSAVIAACRLDQAQRTEKRLYLIDGDLDIALGRPKPRLKHLYRLPAYCIENMLLSEDALVSVATASDVRITEQNAQTKLDFPAIEQRADDTLVPLFIVYATLKHLAVPEKIVSLHGRDLYKNSRSSVSLCPNKTFRRSRNLIRKACAHSSYRSVKAELAKIKSGILQRKLTHREVVSAKDYTLHLIHINMGKLFSLRENFEQFKVRLAQLSTVHLDPNLRRRLTLAFK